MANQALKFATHRHVADAAYHVLEAERALKRAQDKTSSGAVHVTLDRLVFGQRSVRRVLAKVSEHVREGA